MIKFYDLQKVNAKYEDKLQDAFKRVFSNSQYILGSEVTRFEEIYARIIGTKGAVGVGNGFDALRLILRGYMEMGILREGDEIIVPANTFIATILAITENRLVPVLVDPNLYTFNLNSLKIRERITSKTKAIIVVHLYGRPCWNDHFIDLSKVYNLLLIEDNAQAFGSEVSQKKTGSLGDAAAHSFYPTKPLGCLGDGGMVTSNDEELLRVIFQLSNYGSQLKYEHDLRGVNSRLDELQAAFLNVKIDDYYTDLVHRRSVAKYYCDRIKNELIHLPIYDSFSAWHLFVIRTKYRDKLQQYLNKSGIQTLVHYPIPIHKQMAYRETLGSTYLPITEELSKTVLSLPISSVIGYDELEYIIGVVNSWTGN